jgi:hypothetical protein
MITITAVLWQLTPHHQKQFTATQGTVEHYQSINLQKENRPLKY